MQRNLQTLSSFNKLLLRSVFIIFLQTRMIAAQQLTITVNWYMQYARVIEVVRGQKRRPTDKRYQCCTAFALLLALTFTLCSRSPLKSFHLFIIGDFTGAATQHHNSWLLLLLLHTYTNNDATTITATVLSVVRSNSSAGVRVVVQSVGSIHIGPVFGIGSHKLPFRALCNSSRCVAYKNGRD